MRHASLRHGPDCLRILTELRSTSCARSARIALSSLKHIQRARIILLSADRLPVLSRPPAGVSRPAFWRWQQRFAERVSAAYCMTRPSHPAIPLTPLHRR